ncbi:MAG: TldD/PmbA family protein [Candidatus Blackburnbacteria bacterium]|nr:TldD/PmbA family protein [Candidatus Blackburnbacteria bacterium]
MLGEKRLKEISKQVLGFSKAQETEVLLFVTDRCLTRFANSQIHQNVASEDLGISIRVVTRKKIGVASGNSFEESALKDVVKRAEALARLQKEDPHFISLPTPQPLPKIKSKTLQATPEERASQVWTIIKKSKEKGIVASGAYDSSITEIAVANSHGVWAYHAGGASDLSTILIGPESTGFGSSLAKDPKEIEKETERVVESAIEKVIRGEKPQTIEPGEYEVILEPQAVNEMMSFLAWLGPNARLYHEQASNFSSKLGEDVLGENITIIDDPLNEEGFPMPFDFEGHPKRKLEIIKNGKLLNLTYDSYHAGKHKTENTGHALPAPNTFGPIPLHLRFEPGKKSLEEMIKGVKKGLLVTRLWYVRYLNPRSLSITGMTRDGTFLIKNGEIVAGLKNLRFNQSIPDALKNVVEVGRDLTPLASFETELGTNRMPALHIAGWNFTSTTEF